MRVLLITVMFIPVLLGGWTKTAFAAARDPSTAAPCTNDDSRDAQRSVGELLQTQRFADALQVLKLQFARCPLESEIGRLLAETAIEQGEAGYAETVLRSMLSHADDAGLHSLLGRALQQGKHQADAAAQFQIAARMDPSEIHVFDFGASLMKVDVSAAQTVLQYGLTKYPRSIKVRVALALAMYAQGRTDEGAELLCSAADLDPLDVNPMEVLADTGIIPQAVQARAAERLDDLRKTHPHDGLLLFDYAMVQSGRWSGTKQPTSPELVSMLQSALILDPTLAKAHFELARIDEEAENVAGEIHELLEAIRLDPQSAKYHYRLAFAYRRAGDTEHSHEELLRYRTLHSGDPSGG